MILALVRLLLTWERRRLERRIRCAVFDRALSQQLDGVIVTLESLPK